MTKISLTTDVSIAHAPVLSALHATSFARPWDEASFVSLLGSPVIFGCLAVLDEEPVGFALCRGVLDEAELLTICTLPSCRGQGVAKIMMQSLLALCKDLQIATLFLEVSVENLSAKALYVSTGFREISIRRGYYLEEAKEDRRRVDALVMQLQLNEV